MSAGPDALSVVVVSGWFDADPSPIVRALLAERPAVVLHTGRARFSAAVDEVCLEEDVAWVDSCACCGVRLDVRRALGALAARRLPPARVVIEVAPGSDPSLVSQTLLGSHDVSRRWTQVAHVMVLDAFSVATRAASAAAAFVPGAMTDQLAVADVVVLTGVGRLSALGVQRVHTAVRRANSYAAVLTAPSSRDLDAAVESRVALDLAGSPPRSARWGHPSQGEGDPEVVTAWIEVPGRLDPNRLDAWLHELHEESGSALLRIEGDLAVEAEPNRWRVRGARRILEVVDGEPWGEAVPRSRLVIVGRGIDPVTVEADLARCLAADGS